MAVIFHIDLNAFFASAEVVKNSALEGVPLVVAGLGRRSVVCTASYEARQFGVNAAMPLAMAQKLCPDLVVVEGDFEWYSKLSKQFMQLLREYTPKVEPASIDECYVDMSEVIVQYERPMDLAWEIQQRLKDELGLGCSIGIAPNKFLAKMASDMKKPLGITILRKSEIARKLWPLPITAVQGIGKKSAPLLQEAGILTIKDVADPENEQRVRQIFGKYAYTLLQNVRGNGSAKLEYNHTIQSISQSTTMDHDVEDYQEIKQVFQRLANQLSARCIKHDMKGQLISISIRYFDFTNVVRSTTLEHFVSDPQTILETALLLFDQNDQGEVPIRHLGISLGSLKSSRHVVEQMNMFAKRPPKLDLLETLNNQLSGGKLMFASAIVKGEEHVD